MVEDTKPRLGRPPLNREPSAEREPSGRAKRIPLGGGSQRLAGTSRPGYRARWFNDTPGRIEAALQAGYEFCYPDGSNSSDPGDRISELVDMSNSGLRAYKMEIREEWYKEDQKKKHDKILEVEAQIKRGKDTAGEPGVDGRYIPPGGIRL